MGLGGKRVNPGKGKGKKPKPILEPEPEPIPEPIPAPLPSFQIVEVPGLLLRHEWPVAEYESDIAFPLVRLEDGKWNTYIHILRANGLHTEFAVIPNQAAANNRLLMTGHDDLWLGSGIPLTVYHYQSGTLVGTTQFDDTARLLSLEIINQKVILVWYRFVEEPDPSIAKVNISYTPVSQSAWQHLTYQVQGLSRNTPMRAAIVKHPIDGRIWVFSVVDGEPAIAAAVFDGNLSLQVIYPQFISHLDGEYEREGEFPYLLAFTDGTRIILAYQAHTYKFFSIDPFCKGAYLVARGIDPNGTKSIVAKLDQWAERVLPFALLRNTAGQFIFAYQQCNPDTFSFGEVYLSQPYQKLGELYRHTCWISQSSKAVVFTDVNQVTKIIRPGD